MLKRHVYFCFVFFKSDIKVFVALWGTSTCEKYRGYGTEF